MYVTIMSAYAVLHIWPPLTYRYLDHFRASDRSLAWRALQDVAIALVSSAVLLSTRGLVLVYLFVSSISLEIGISVLLWQQFCYIYEGQTYLSSLSMRGGDEAGEKDCKNLFRFFGCPYPVLRFLPNFWNSPKRHEKWNGYVGSERHHYFLQNLENRFPFLLETFQFLLGSTPRRLSLSSSDCS